MDKNKQITQKSNVGVTLAMYWITIALGAIFCLIGWLGIKNLSPDTIFRTGQIAVYVLVMAGTLGGIVLTISGRQQLGAQFIYFAVPILGLMSVLTTNGAIIGSFVVLLVNVIASYSIFSSKLRRRYLIISLVTFILSWIIEWINPAWREGSPQHIEIGIISVSAFVLIVIIIVAVQVWRVSGSLRNKLLIGITSLTIISVAILAFFNYYNNQLNLTASSGAAIKSVADSQAAAIGNILLQETQVLQSFDLSKVVQDRVDQVNASYGSDQAANLSQIQLLDTQWRAADKADNNNDPLVSKALNSEVASELSEFKDTFPENVEVFVTDKYGANIAATNRTSDYYQADEAWWQASYNNGQGAVYIGEPEFDQSSKTFGVILAVPLYSHGTKEVSGVMRTTIKMDSILAILNANVLGGTGHTSLYLPKGQVLDPKNENGVRPTDPNALALLPELTSAKTYDTFTLDSVPSVVSAAQVTSTDSEVQAGIKNLGWQVVVSQTQADNLAPIRKQTQSTIVIVLIILVISALAGLFLAQLLSNPIVRLTAVAEQIAEGNNAVQAKVESTDEIGKLASTFNSMTAQLREFIGSLEQRVAERTESLELAAEVGRSVSQVRALDVMLKNATEIIRSRFDLYYVQIYLADPTQTSLLLFSGTGKVGAELLSRSHRLPLNTSSINGRAATEKKSVVITDTTASATFRPNPLLPNTRSEMAVPLLVGDKVVGVLDLQSEQANALNREILTAFEALAGQLAIAIQNANLLAETNQARAEVEAQARRLVRTNWTDYMDAIHKPEETGFVFEQNQISAMTKDKTIKENSLVAPISVTGETLGNLVVEMGAQSQGARTSELVNTIALQVAQHIENLRLLESAERYRAEAEKASRRITREGWNTYAENASEGLSYMYDLKEVRPFTGNGGEENETNALTLPLKVRDESIGRISVSGIDNNNQEAIDLINVVTERLGAHIESLRQNDETQSALAQSEKLFEASRNLTQSADLQGLVKAAVESFDVLEIDRAVLGAITYGSDGETEGMTIVANWSGSSEFQATAIGTQYTKEVLRSFSLFTSSEPLFFNDMLEDQRIDEVTLGIAKRANYRTLAALPLFIGPRQDGVLLVEGEKPHNFTQDEIRLFSALAPQISTVLENRRQFERAQQQANRESTLNIISQKIQSATSVEAVLQIAARELGHALGAPMTVAQLSMKDNKS